MVDVSPFCGWRYQLGQVGDLADVTAPYDVIGPEELIQLRQKHPANIVHLILPESLPDDPGPDECYQRAAALLAQFKLDGILARDHADAYYVYHQTFEIAGEKYVRKGFLGRLKLSPFGEGQVFPHERTLAAPKADRLKLFRAVKTNLSPIFGLYEDPAGEVEQVLTTALAGQTGVQLIDEQRVLHQLWPISDPQVMSKVTSLMKSRPVVIADGHHRYETALAYRDELVATGTLTNELHAANSVMCMFVASEDGGLMVLPTHRIVKNWQALTAQQIGMALTPVFEVDVVGSHATAAQDAWDLAQSCGNGCALALGTSADSTWVVAELKDMASMRLASPGKSDEWCQLPVSVLHQLVLPRLAPLVHPREEADLEYVHEDRTAARAIEEKSAGLAVLVPATSVTLVEMIAQGGEVLPQIDLLLPQAALGNGVESVDVGWLCLADLGSSPRLFF